MQNQWRGWRRLTSSFCILHSSFCIPADPLAVLPLRAGRAARRMSLGTAALLLAGLAGVVAVGAALAGVAGGAGAVGGDVLLLCLAAGLGRVRYAFDCHAEKIITPPPDWGGGNIRVSAGPSRAATCSASSPAPWPSPWRAAA